MGEYVSIIILNWNGKEYIEKCLASVLIQTYSRYEVVLIDNASTDGSLDLVRQKFPGIKMIRNDENLGFAGGMNVGLKETEGEIIALLNQDVTVKENWLTELVRAMTADEKVGIAGGKILYPDEKTIQHAGGLFNFPLGLTEHYGYGEIDEGQYDEMREVDYVTGAALGVKREMLEEIGYFDEGFFPAYFEEADLCFRARKAGYKVIYVPQAVAIHHESTSTGRFSYDYHYYYHRNRLRFVLKHYTLEQLFQDFLPAEMGRLKTGLSEDEVRALKAAYSAYGIRPDANSRQETGITMRESGGEAGEEIKAGGGKGSTGETELAWRLAELEAKWQVEERPFTSTVPLLGPLIAFLREKWNEVSTKWYVRAILQQQLEFNFTAVQAVKSLVKQREAVDAAIALNTALLNHRLDQIEGAISERLGKIERMLSRER